MGTWTNKDGLLIKFGNDKNDMGVVGKHSEETLQDLSVTFSGATYGDVSLVIPAGFRVVRSIGRVTEAFALGGTTPALEVGWTGDTDAAAKLTEAQAEAVGVYATDGAATTAVQTADRTLIVSLTGTSPTIGTGGKATVTVTIQKV